MKKETVSQRLFIACFFTCLLFSLPLSSQICSGSLGDPVVNVDFGTGTNPGNPLLGNVITYTYTSSACPDDGFYTIVNSASNCFGGTWHTINEDHTAGDVNGYMLLINASFNPGDFYIDTVKNLCANTTYEFGAWITNVIKASSCGFNNIRPNLVFKIEAPDGTVLGSYSTGSIDANQAIIWKQYGLFFTTPGGNSTVVIRITNNAPGGCGNDIAIDDITFRPCGPKVDAGIGNNNATSIAFCKDGVQAVTLTGTVGAGYVSPSLQWQESLNNGAWTDINGASGSTFNFTKTSVGFYQYRLAVAQGLNISTSNCRVISNPDTIDIRELPAAAINSNSPVCEKGTVQLEASGGVLYSWTGPNNFSGNSNTVSLDAVIAVSGLYTVNVTDAYGCKAAATTNVIVNTKPIAAVSSNKTICSGNSTTLESNGGSSYLWVPGDGISDITSRTPIANPATTTTYNVIVTNAVNCKDTAAVTITVNESPVANAGPDKYMLKGETSTLDGIVLGGDVNFYWTPAEFLSDPFIENPVTDIAFDTVYTLHVVSKNGCGTDEDEVTVNVYNDLFIPKAFTPNNDGRNDSWRLDGLLAFPKAIVRVYDRFGKKVFEGGSNSTWDGNYKNEPASAGAYVYFVDLKNGKPLLKGNVVLIR